MKANPIKLPKKLLVPVGAFLDDQLKNLKKRRKLINREDPFLKARDGNKAAPDTGAADREGHDRARALREQLDKKIVQTKKAMARVRGGDYATCEECGEMIDTDRLVIYPETTRCIKCERKREKKK